MSGLALWWGRHWHVAIQCLMGYFGLQDYYLGSSPTQGFALEIHSRWMAYCNVLWALLMPLLLAQGNSPRAINKIAAGTQKLPENTLLYINQGLTKLDNLI